MSEHRNDRSPEPNKSLSLERPKAKSRRPNPASRPHGSSRTPREGETDRSPRPTSPSPFRRLPTDIRLGIAKSSAPPRDIFHLPRSPFSAEFMDPHARQRVEEWLWAVLPLAVPYGDWPGTSVSVLVDHGSTATRVETSASRSDARNTQSQVDDGGVRAESCVTEKADRPVESCAVKLADVGSVNDTATSVTGHSHKGR